MKTNIRSFFPFRHSQWGPMPQNPLFEKGLVGEREPMEPKRQRRRNASGSAIHNST